MPLFSTHINNNKIHCLKALVTAVIIAAGTTAAAQTTEAPAVVETTKTVTTTPAVVETTKTVATPTTVETTKTVATEPAVTETTTTTTTTESPPTTQTTQTVEVATPAESKWHFRIAPFLWPINMDGTIQIGSRRAHIDTSTAEMWNNLNYGGLLLLEAMKNEWGFFFNALLVSLRDSAYDAGLKMDAKSNYSLFTAGVSYTIYAQKGWNIAPYAGLRYTHNRTSLSVAQPTVNFYLKDNMAWIDPIIGASFEYKFTPVWSILFAGDIGGNNTSEHFSYNLLGLLGWTPQSLSTHPTIYLGYRSLTQSYIVGNGSGRYAWNMKLGGPLLGIAFTF